MIPGIGRISPEFLIEVKRGNVAGRALVQKFGRNDGWGCY
tara:strand:- start:170 stop:289 length:120 start_codon:yes stop_codon:yes gene_type:complete